MPESMHANVKRTLSSMVRFVFTLALLGALIIPVFLLTVGNRPLSTDPETLTKLVRVPQGLHASQIITLLDEEGIIANPTLFHIIVKIEGAEQSLKAGSYLLSARMTPLDIIEQLQTGRVQTERVVIPEGFEIRQIAEVLATRNLADRDRFIELASDVALVYGENGPLDLPLETLEGYLYPDTYLFHEGQTEEDLIRQMVARFIAVTETDITPLLEGSEFTLHEVVTLASIVEREIAVDHERPVVASVYLNRLAINMPLQADPTVRYVTTEDRPQVLYRDLEIDSPYNTYRYGGLPPGPIASPGLASMLAVLNPAETEYYFFVSRRDGTHEFTQTYNEHLRARRTLGY
ncbi:MAG TPA: endolytic transglycosylase MltG [Limnochordia bacterium]|nr:endolytic transglycosylase MltG [Limnochordia bacterium]